MTRHDEQLSGAFGQSAALLAGQQQAFETLTILVRYRSGKIDKVDVASGNALDPIVRSLQCTAQLTQAEVGKCRLPGQLQHIDRCLDREIGGEFRQAWRPYAGAQRYTAIILAPSPYASVHRGRRPGDVSAALLFVGGGVDGHRELGDVATFDLDAHVLAQHGGSRAEIDYISGHHLAGHYVVGEYLGQCFRVGQQGFEFARQMFARAIVIEPSYSRAYAGVADCCSFLYMYFDSSEANLKEADSASRKAVEIDPEDAEAHASRGLALSLSGKHEESDAEFKRAIELNPKLYEAHYLYARALFGLGRHEGQLAVDLRVAETGHPGLELVAVVGTAGDDQLIDGSELIVCLGPDRSVEGVADDGRSPHTRGGLAQLGERLAGSQKVIGSSPLSSTRGVFVTPQASLSSEIVRLVSFLEEP